jgi:uncharacterized damage-inducible protein DinB
MTRSILTHAFAHHAWANERIFEACGSLGSAELMAPVPGAYGPIIAILHHLVDADAFYLRVLTGRDDFVSIDENSRFSVEELATFSKQHEAAYAAYLDSATDPDADVVEHGEGFEFHAPLGIRLGQVLHHGTDHRSQICTALTGLELTPPLIDLWDYAEARGMSTSVDLREDQPTT